MTSPLPPDQNPRRGRSSRPAGGGRRPPAPPPPPPPPDLYASPGDFFTEVLSIWYARHSGGEFQWCERWADHPEAYERVRALHLAYEDANRATAAGLGDSMLRWWNGADSMMGRLLDPAGTFARCLDVHKLLPPLGEEELPD